MTVILANDGADIQLRKRTPAYIMVSGGKSLAIADCVSGGTIPSDRCALRH